MPQKTQIKPRIGLVMIVKNESEIIQRCLSSVVDVIDEYLIVDTGSTDNTIQIIKDFFKNHPKISGQVVEKVWKNFGHNRTESLEIAKSKLDVDWLLTIDADMILVNHGFDPNILDSNIGAYQVYQRNGSLKYANIRLMNNKYLWRSIGVTHEYLASDESSKKLLYELWIDDIGDGGAKGDKFQRDIQLLEQGLIDEPNNVRYMFYLANSYKDTQQWEKAIRWYQKRIDAGGWLEEITCSYEYMGLCYEGLGDYTKAIDIWLEGYEKNPKRAECIYNAIRLLRTDGKNLVAYNLAKMAKEIPFPKNDVLFINHNVYDYLIDNEISILAYYADKNRDVRGIFKKLIANPKANYINLISNYKFYCKSIQSFELLKIDFDDIHKIEGYHNSSPGLVKNEDGYLVNLRHVSYEIDHKTGAYLEASDKTPCKNVNTLNSRIQFNDDFQVIDIKTYQTPDLNENHVNGIEDIRIFQNGNKISFSGNRWLNQGEIKVIFGDYNSDFKQLEYDILQSPTFRQCEKNWSPFIHNNELKFIYDWSPIEIGQIQDNNLKIVQTLEKSLHNFRGSSPGVVYGDYIWFLTHCVEYSTPRRYYHSFVLLDKETLEYVDHSKLFTFDSEKIEFAVGFEIVEGKIIITHSTWDSKAYLKVYDFQELTNELFDNE